MHTRGSVEIHRLPSRRYQSYTRLYLVHIVLQEKGLILASLTHWVSPTLPSSRKFVILLSLSECLGKPRLGYLQLPVFIKELLDKSSKMLETSRESCDRVIA